MGQSRGVHLAIGCVVFQEAGDDCFAGLVGLSRGDVGHHVHQDDVQIGFEDPAYVSRGTDKEARNSGPSEYAPECIFNLLGPIRIERSIDRLRTGNGNHMSTPSKEVKRPLSLRRKRVHEHLQIRNHASVHLIQPGTEQSRMHRVHDFLVDSTSTAASLLEQFEAITLDPGHAFRRSRQKRSKGDDLGVSLHGSHQVCRVEHVDFAD